MEIKIYLITNRINGKKYVGQTSRTIEQRFNEHASCRRTAIDKAIAKYGRENFTVEELETCEIVEQANEREQYWIAFCGCMAPKGYNLTTGGKSNALKPVSQETRKNMSASAKRRAQTPEGRAQLLANLEKAHTATAEKRRNGEVQVSQKARDNMSASAKQRVKTPEGHANMVTASEKAKEVLEEKLKDPEQRAQMYADRKGRRLSDKGRANLAEGAKRRAQTPEGKAHLLAMSMKAKKLAEEKRRQKLEQQANNDVNQNQTTDKEDQNG